MQSLNKKYLLPSALIESDHPEIRSQAEKLTYSRETNQEKIKSIFYFVRDEIKYLFGMPPSESAVKASSVLHAKKGFCTQKAILFCSLTRSCSIPSAINFYDIIDHDLSDYIARILKTRKLFRHGVPAVMINDKWIQYDATLDIALVQKKGLRPVEFSPDRDCLMHPTTLDGNKHIEYVHDYGLTHDVSYQQIMHWMKQGYPHLIST
ncbi:MAG: transglutaminase-like domain-containing protein [bacterium]